MAMLAHLKMLKGGSLDKVFFNLNHCLKFEYKNPRIWALLGQMYQLKSGEELEVNLEKAAFCFTKSSKYQSAMGGVDVQGLLRLIPKFIYWSLFA